MENYYLMPLITEVWSGNWISLPILTWISLTPCKPSANLCNNPALLISKPSITCYLTSIRPKVKAFSSKLLATWLFKLSPTAIGEVSRHSLTRYVLLLGTSPISWKLEVEKAEHNFQIAIRSRVSGYGPHGRWNHLGCSQTWEYSRQNWLALVELTRNTRPKTHFSPENNDLNITRNPK